MTLPGKDRALPAAVLVAASVIAFGRTVGHGFLFLDDPDFIVDNHLIADPSPTNLLALWTRPLNDLYAPLTYTLWGLVSMSAGTTAWAFHATNLALHAVNAWLVFGLIRRFAGRNDAALAGALLFAVHPVQTETVAWASETKDLLTALLSLVAIREYLRFHDTDRFPAYLLASGAFTCALLAKPSAVVTPALVVVLERGLRPDRWRTSLSWLAPWFIAATAFALFTAHVQPATGRLAWVPPVWLRPMLALDAISFYLRKLFVPLHLVPDYGRTSLRLHSTGALLYTWIPATALLVVASLVPRVRVAVGLFVVALLPVLGFVAFDFQHYSNVADHYLYLAMLGPAFGLAAAYPDLGTVGRRLAVPLVIAILLTLSVAQSAHWRDDATLGEWTVSVNPRSALAHNNWGQLLESRGDLTAALSHYRAALANDPDAGTALNNVGHVLYEQGRWDDAIRHYTDALARPGAPRGIAARMHNNLGAAYVKTERYQEAAEEFRRAIALDPEYLEPYYNLGSVLMAFGRNTEAIDIFRRGLLLNPRHGALRAQLAVALSRSGR